MLLTVTIIFFDINMNLKTEQYFIHLLIHVLKSKRLDYRKIIEFIVDFLT